MYTRNNRSTLKMIGAAILIVCVCIGVYHAGQQNSTPSLNVPTPPTPAIATPTVPSAVPSTPATAPTVAVAHTSTSSTSTVSQHFHGFGDQNLPNITVTVGSELHWQCNACGNGVFAIDGIDQNFDSIPTNTENQSSGSTYLPAGTYTGVSVMADGGQDVSSVNWAFNITAGQ
jgi:hypothetical protein